MTSKRGQIKQTRLKEFEATRISRPIVNMKLKADDEVINISVSETGLESVLLVSEKGLTLKYPISEVSATGLKSQGVKAMNVKADDALVYGALIPEEGNLITVSNRGAVKRTSLSTFEAGARAQVGSMLYKDIKSKPHRIVAAAVTSLGQDLQIEIQSENSSHTLRANEVRLSGKYSNGSFVVEEESFGIVTQAYFNTL